MPRPIVGVSGGALTAERQQKQHALRSVLHAAGCVPVLLRPEEGATALGRVHALVLPGGGDIHPSRYGHEPRAELRGVDPEREDFELELARAGVAEEIPVLGICLGLQVLVVAFGGTLHQHVPDLPAAVSHEGGGVSHEVRLDPAARLTRTFGVPTLATNSSHHQAPDDIPAILAVAGRTADGIVEAVEGPGFTVGVGWHPETMADVFSARLLSAFVASAEDAARRRHPIRP